MELLQALKFVKNGYARKDIIPELTHYSIRKGRVTAYNGMLGFSSPIDLDLDIAPVALHFHKCIEACEEKISITKDKDKIRIKSGNFKSLVRCIPTEKVPTLIPRGKCIELPNNFVEIASNLLHIIEESSHKVYATALTLRGKSAYVTNNIIIVEQWLGVDMPTINIPKRAIQEIVRHGEEIDHILIDDDMIYFMYSDSKWIASKLFVCEFPDVTKVLDQPANPRAFPVGFWDALQTLSRFADDAGKVTLSTGKMETGEGLEDALASVDCPELILEEPCLFNCKELLKIKDLATTIDLVYGRACLFYGNMLRGAIVGYRK